MWVVLRNPFNAKFDLFNTLNSCQEWKVARLPKKQQPGGLFPVVRAVQWTIRLESTAYFLTASFAAGTLTASSLLAPALTVTLYSRFR